MENLRTGASFHPVPSSGCVLSLYLRRVCGPAHVTKQLQVIFDETDTIRWDRAARPLYDHATANVSPTKCVADSSKGAMRYQGNVKRSSAAGAT